MDVNRWNMIGKLSAKHTDGAKDSKKTETVIKRNRNRKLERTDYAELVP